jgi:hypothetical protein
MYSIAKNLQPVHHLDFIYVNYFRVYAYENEEFPQCVANFEKALIGYFHSRAECHNLCFGLSPQMPQFPSFWRNLADMELKVKQCRQNCEESQSAEGKWFNQVEMFAKIDRITVPTCLL